MLTLDELIESLQKVRNKHSNTKVALVMYGDNSIHSDYATSVYYGESGTVYIICGGMVKIEL